MIEDRKHLTALEEETSLHDKAPTIPVFHKTDRASVNEAANARSIRRSLPSMENFIPIPEHPRENPAIIPVSIAYQPLTE